MPEVSQQVGPILDRIGSVMISQVGGIETTEDPQSAALARRDALRAVWALKGLPLVDYSEDSITISGEGSEKIDEMLSSESPADYLLSSSDRQAAARRIVNDRPRRDLLDGVVAVARSRGASTVSRDFARQNLGGVLDVLDHRVNEPEGSLSGVIFTQTKLNMGIDRNVIRPKPFGVDEYAWSVLQIVRGSMPYLGSAHLYSEAMATGHFSDIRFVDFRDKQGVNEVLDEGGVDIAFVAGATTDDRDHITSLNCRLARLGITTVNGGVAPTLDMDPRRYVRDGSSVYLGELEGAMPYLMDQLVRDPTPRIFSRGGSESGRMALSLTNTGNITRLGVPKTVDMQGAYDKEHELNRRNLATRLEALAMMRPPFDFNGTDYEPSSRMQVHQINTSFGCPERCSFCATEPFQGTKMRHRDLESIDRELGAVEAKIIAVVDQNFTANGREFFVEFLELLRKHGKRFAYEGELMFYLECPEGGDPDKYFFDGSPEDAYREQLLKDTVLAIEVGLEQPVKVQGTIVSGKNPDQYDPAMQRLNDMGIMVFGTAMVGLPKELWAPRTTEEPIIPYDNLSEKEWNEVIDTWVEWSKRYPGLILFSFSATPGTRAYKILAERGLLNYVEGSEGNDDTIRPVQSDAVKGISSRKALAEIQDRIASPEVRRIRMSQARFTWKARIFMEIFNRAARHVFGSRME